MHCNSVHSITWDIKINLFLPLRWPNFIIIWYFPPVSNLYIPRPPISTSYQLDAFFVSYKEHNFQYCFKHQVRTTFRQHTFAIISSEGTSYLCPNQVYLTMKYLFFKLQKAINMYSRNQFLLMVSSCYLCCISLIFCWK